MTFSTDVIGDPVIVRSDGRPAYNFAVVVDDALMEITHVIRGEDHISNTPRQVLLYQALGFTPPAFAHLSLVLGPDHTPLSKRHGATSVAEFRERGYLPEALVNYLALHRLVAAATASQELLPIDELARRFALEDVGHSAGVFDPEKLAWMNRHYMKVAAPARLAAEAAALLPGARLPARGAPTRRWSSSRRCCRWRSARSIGSRRFRIACAFLFEFDRGGRAARAPEVAEVLHEPGAREVIAALAEELREAGRLDRDAFRAAADRVQAADRAEGTRAVPSDPRRADRRGGRARARSRGAGDRSRRGAAAVGRRGADPRLPRARRSVRAARSR